MNLEHEYALLGGYNRSKVGRWLYAAAATVSAVIVFIVLAGIDLVKTFGVAAVLPPSALSLIGAASVYGGLYWLFDGYGWKIGVVGRFLRIPDLAGTWRCEGVTLEKEPNISWEGSVRIIQSWDKIRVHLETAHSASDSIAAALLHDAASGYRLMYHYQNSPKIGETGINAHHGFAELTFAPGEQTASGGYFNGRGRVTWGTMTLTKEPPHGT